jgi:hypothetical protein
MVKCVCYTGLWIYWFHDLDAIIPNCSVTIGRTSLVGVGHSGSDLIMPLMLRMICYALEDIYIYISKSPNILFSFNFMGSWTFFLTNVLGTHHGENFLPLRPSKMCSNLTI